jgi:hypothetical protein
VETLKDRVAFLLVTQGWAQVRTGKRRTEAAARKILRGVAADIGMEVTTSKGEGYIRAESKGE